MTTASSLDPPALQLALFPTFPPLKLRPAKFSFVNSTDPSRCFYIPLGSRKMAKESKSRWLCSNPQARSNESGPSRGGKVTLTTGTTTTASHLSPLLVLPQIPSAPPQPLAIKPLLPFERLCLLHSVPNRLASPSLLSGSLRTKKSKRTLDANLFVKAAVPANDQKNTNPAHSTLSAVTSSTSPICAEGTRRRHPGPIIHTLHQREPSRFTGTRREHPIRARWILAWLLCVCCVGEWGLGAFRIRLSLPQSQKDCLQRIIITHIACSEASLETAPPLVHFLRQRVCRAPTRGCVQML